MAIDRATVGRLGGSFLDALRLDVDTQLTTRRSVGYQLDQTAELLPEPDAWAVVGEREDAALLLLERDALFTITRVEPPEQDAQLLVTCRPFRLTEVAYRRWGQQTFWTFEFRHGDPLAIEGKLDYRNRPEDDETFDQAETFARALAARAGWPTRADGI